MPPHAHRGARGVRLDPTSTERTRAKIATSQITNRLTDHINGKVEMSATQVTAALGLLRKTLPDLSATELSGEVAQPTVVRAPKTSGDSKAWSKDYAPEQLQPDTPASDKIN